MACRAAFLLTLLICLSPTGHAQEIIVRKALPAAPVERRLQGLVFTLPAGNFTRSLSGTWITRHTEQDATFTYRPEADTPVFLRYTLGGRAEDAFANGRNSGWSQSVGLQQRPALVAEFNEKSSLEAALESSVRFDQTMRTEAVQKWEMLLQTGQFPGLTLSTRGGRADLRSQDGSSKTQFYTTLNAEQKLPQLPFRVGVAPSLAREISSADPAWLTGWNTTLFWDAFSSTTLSVSTMQSGRDAEGETTAFRSYSTQVEQRVNSRTSMRVGAGYEEQWTNAALSTTAVFVGADSFFSLTDFVSGSFQIRQRAIQLLDAAGSLPETVFSLSLGGSF